MRKIPPILLSICPYLMFLMFSLSGEDKNKNSMIVTIWGLTTIFIFAVNIINVIVFVKKDRPLREIAFWDMLVKLIHIPYYMILFVFGVLCAILSITPQPTMIITFMLVILVIITDLILLFMSSLYGFAAIRVGKKDGSQNGVERILYTICHCLFCFDVIAAIVMFVRSKRSELR